MQDETKNNNEPPAYATGSGSTQGLTEGLYTLFQKKIRKYMVLSQAKIEAGAPCVGWLRITQGAVDNQFWVVKNTNEEGIYTIMSFRADTFLDLIERNGADGAGVVAHYYVESTPSRLNQEWRILEEVPGFNRLQCTRTGTFLEMDNLSSELWRRVFCSRPALDRDIQLWGLDRVSRTTLEIKDILRAWKSDLLDCLVQPYDDGDQYFVLPHDLLTTIWDGTKLRDQPICKNTFDYDDFVIKAKDAVNTWARDNLQIHGYSVLFGIIFGGAKIGPKAYNWYLSADMRSLVLFDPQTGAEYTPTVLVEFGFEPTFAMF